MDFTWDDPLLQQCQDEYNKLDPEQSLFMSHYELAKATSINDSSVWKMFLTHPKVSEWLNTETTLFNNVQVRKLYKQAATNNKSPGTAQMINALNKALDDSSTKEGPICIYSYVPLNEKEIQAPNVQILTRDIFKKGE